MDKYNKILTADIFIRQSYGIDQGGLYRNFYEQLARQLSRACFSVNEVKDVVFTKPAWAKDFHDEMFWMIVTAALISIYHSGVAIVRSPLKVGHAVRALQKSFPRANLLNTITSQTAGKLEGLVYRFASTALDVDMREIGEQGGVTDDEKVQDEPERTEKTAAAAAAGTDTTATQDEGNVVRGKGLMMTYMWMLCDYVDSGEDYKNFLKPDYREYMLTPDYLETKESCYDVPAGFMSARVLSGYVAQRDTKLTLFMMYAMMNSTSDIDIRRLVDAIHTEDAALSDVVNKIKDMARDYRHDIPGDLVSEIAKVYPTQQDFVRTLLHFWMGSSMLYPATVLTVSRSFRPDTIIVHTCSTTMDVPFSADTTQDIVTRTIFYAMMGGGGHGFQMAGSRATTTVVQRAHTIRHKRGNRLRMTSRQK